MKQRYYGFAAAPAPFAGVVHGVQDGLFSAALCRAVRKPDVGYDRRINRKAQGPKKYETAVLRVRSRPGPSQVLFTEQGMDLGTVSA